MEITGKLIKTLPVQSGNSARGTWQKQDFVIETQEQYPRKVCISVWGDKVRDLEGIQVGETLTVSINIESREYNDRWYTEVRAWKIQRAGAGQGAGVPPMVDTGISGDFNLSAGDDEVDDLPF